MGDGALRRNLRAFSTSVFLRSFCVGLVAALGHPPFGVWILTLLAFAAAFYQLARVSDARAAFALGWGFGSGYFALSLSWIVEPFFVEPWRHGWMAPFAIVLLALGLGLFYAGAFWLAKRLRHSGWPVALSLTGAELLRAYVFTGFPWAMPGYVLVDQYAAQAAAYVGPHGLNLAFFAVAGGLAWSVINRINRYVGMALAVAAIAVFAVPMRAVDRASTPISDAARPVVRLVQPNAPQHQKWHPDYAGIFFERLVRYSRDGSERPDLIVWPETAVPVWLNTAADTLSIISNAAGDVPVVLGINRAQGARIFNAAVLLDAEGRVTATYDKHHLVPFGEYIPFGDVLSRFGLSGFASQSGDGFSPGPGPAVMDLGALGKALVLICYEAVFPQDVRGAPERPGFILHLTNDAWFGNISGPYQHLVQARMRAIESGLPVLRAANTGVSGVIDAHGRILASMALNTEGYLDVSLPKPHPATLYSKSGDVPLTIVVVLLLLGAQLTGRRKTH